MAIAERKRAKMGIKGTIAKMDATVEGAKALKTKYGVTGFPTMIHFADGVWVEWTQKHLTKATSSDLVGYLARFQGVANPLYEELGDKDDLAAFREAHSEAAIGCFSDLDGDAAYLFKRACRVGIMSKWATKCALAQSEDVHASLNAKDSSVVLFQGEQFFTKTFDGGTTDLATMQRALVTPGRVMTSVSDRKDHAHEFRLFPTQLMALVPDGATDTVADLLQAVYSAMDDVHTSIHTGESTTVTLAAFGLTAADLPVLVALDTTSSADSAKLSRRYLPPWGVGLPKDATAVLAWLERIASGEAEPYFARSGPVVDDAGSAVKTIVASTFKERVLLGKEHAFVLFAKPQEKPRWLDFELASAAKQFADILTLGTFDTEANEIPVSHGHTCVLHAANGLSQLTTHPPPSQFPLGPHHKRCPATGLSLKYLKQAPLPNFGQTLTPHRSPTTASWKVRPLRSGLPQRSRRMMKQVTVADQGRVGLQPNKNKTADGPTGRGRARGSRGRPRSIPLEQVNFFTCTPLPLPGKHYKLIISYAYYF